jgi:osmotically-inducible protein OsmY
MEKDAVRKQVHAALEREHRINLHRYPVRIGAADGTVTLEGEVADVAAKKLALALATSVRGVRAVVDRLRVAPGERRGDGAVRDSREIEISVTDGVILLEGHVISQSHLRFAGALAWWTLGRRDVINALEVRPAYEDHDDEVAEVARLVLEADPELDSDLIRAGCNGKVVTLDGSVPSEQQKRRAELDAWSLFAIKGVVNRLQVG